MPRAHETAAYETICNLIWYETICNLIWGQTPAPTARDAYEAEYQKFDPRVEGEAQEDAPEDNEDSL